MKLSESIVTIVGAGLMGGSLGKALIRSRACKEVRAAVRRDEAAEECVSTGAAHVADTNHERLVNDSDLIVISTPVRTIERQVLDLGKYMKPGGVVTDMGSVKRGIVRAMEELPPYVSAVGGHPMCGKETSGIDAADPDLFQGKVWVLTPLKHPDHNAAQLVTELASSVGARTVTMNAEDHDAIAACISHLCYMLAATLVGVAEDTSEELPDVWTLASSGFRDTTRVAGVDLTMVMDIIGANRDNVSTMLTRARDRIDNLLRLLENEDEKSLREELSKVRKRRTAMY